ncbi:type II toxin-antitoxin system RelE/ParE family toxin [Thiolapillus brandeum]|nr:type II toxin-antitoxin system RelE/ParE family toxin [Thiolapillus brandeum]
MLDAAVDLENLKRLLKNTIFRQPDCRTRMCGHFQWPSVIENGGKTKSHFCLSELKKPMEGLFQHPVKVPPGNRLEPLQGNRAGQWSIRINDQWRICFRWDRGHAFDVEITDYH